MIVLELRCVKCHGDRMLGSAADGWVCATCGSTRTRYYRPKVVLPTVAPKPQPPVGPRVRRRKAGV